MAILYVLLAGSMLVRGVEVMRDFGGPEVVVSARAFGDFFAFFYELMAGVGVLIATFGHVVRDRQGQTRVASVLCAWNALATWRDLSTSDSAFGNHLYRGSATLIPVFIDLALTLLFASIAYRGGRSPRQSVR